MPKGPKLPNLPDPGELEPGEIGKEPPLPKFLRRRMPRALRKFPGAEEEESEYYGETPERSPRRPKRRARRLRGIGEEESPEEEEEDFLEESPSGENPDAVAERFGVTREELLDLMSRRGTWAWRRAAAEFPPLGAIPEAEREAVERAIRARARAIAEEALERGGGMARLALRGVVA